VQEAASILVGLGIELEIIDVQTLIPFDTKKVILESLKKTGALLLVDEDVPGGATSYMMQQILEVQGAFDYLDVQAQTVTAPPNRAAYGRDGDFYGKPQLEDVVQAAYGLMRQRNPRDFLYRKSLCAREDVYEK
jgi:pyruvate/2-oxoglutarate/acetoin dehydrogenase E1 component